MIVRGFVYETPRLILEPVSKIANVEVPKAIDEIRTAPVLHDTVCDKEDMKSVVMKFLGI